VSNNAHLTINRSGITPDDLGPLGGAGGQIRPMEKEYGPSGYGFFESAGAKRSKEKLKVASDQDIEKI